MTETSLPIPDNKDSLCCAIRFHPIRIFSFQTLIGQIIGDTYINNCFTIEKFYSYILVLWNRIIAHYLMHTSVYVQRSCLAFRVLHSWLATAPTPTSHPSCPWTCAIATQFHSWVSKTQSLFLANAYTWMGKQHVLSFYVGIALDLLSRHWRKKHRRSWRNIQKGM